MHACAMAGGCTVCLSSDALLIRVNTHSHYVMSEAIHWCLSRWNAWLWPDTKPAIKSTQESFRTNSQQARRNKQPARGLKSTPLMLQGLLPRFFGPLCATRIGTVSSGTLSTVSAILFADASASAT